MSPHILFSAETGWVRSLFELNMDTVVQMIVPNFINFVIIACLLTFLLYRPVRKLLAARTERIAKTLSDADDSNLTASELKEKYENLLSDIEAERTSILDEARRVGKERQAQILADAKAEALEVREKAHKDIASEKERIKESVYTAIIDISADMAEKLIAVKVDKDAHDRLFAEALHELESTTFRKDTVVV